MSDVPPRDDDPREDEQPGQGGDDSGNEPHTGGDLPSRPGGPSEGVGSASGIGFGGPGPRGGTGAGGGGGGGGEENPFADLLGQLMGGGVPGFDLSQLSAAGIPTDPATLNQVLSQVQRMLSTAGEGPVNWDLAKDLARQAAAQSGDPSIGATPARQTAEALRLAEMWLDASTGFPASSASAGAWSRAEWVEETLATWRRLAEPVAASVADAMAAAMSQQAPPEMQAMIASAGTMMRQVGGAVFGMQVGQAVGALASEVLSSYDIGLPLTEGGTALLPTNVDAFADGLGVPLDEVRLYLALREAAHARLFAHVPWLRAHLLGAVEAYARGITIDTDLMERAVRDVDPTDPQALQQALSEGLFEPQRTPVQQAALDRLETALALVEGWVDEVVDGAARTQLPHAAAMRETMRRRRAAGGPAEHTLASLVGLELRPRRLREAATLWASLAEARGTDGRDAVWSHPDLLPTAEDLDHPTSFATRRGDAEAASADVDAAIEALLQEPAAGERPSEDGDPSDGPEGDR